MNTRVKKILEVEIQCFESYPCQHIVSYVDQTDRICKEKFDGIELQHLISIGVWNASENDKKHFAEYDENK